MIRRVRTMVSQARNRLSESFIWFIGGLIFGTQVVAQTILTQVYYISERASTLNRRLILFSIFIGIGAAALVTVFESALVKAYLQVLAVGQFSMLAIIVSITVLSVSSSEHTQIVAKLFKEQGYLSTTFALFGISILTALFGLLLPAELTLQGFGLSLHFQIISIFLSSALATAGFLYIMRLKDYMLDYVGSPDLVLNEIAHSTTFAKYRLRDSDSSGDLHNPPRLLSEAAQEYIERGDLYHAQSAVAALNHATKRLIQENYKFNQRKQQWINLWGFWHLSKQKFNPFHKSDSGETFLVILAFAIINLTDGSITDEHENGFINVFTRWDDIADSAIKYETEAVLESLADAQVEVVDVASSIDYTNTAQSATRTLSTLIRKSAEKNLSTSVYSSLGEALKRSIESRSERITRDISEELGDIAVDGIPTTESTEHEFGPLNEAAISSLCRGYSKALTTVNSDQTRIFRSLEIQLIDFINLCLESDSNSAVMDAWGEALSNVLETATQEHQQQVVQRLARLYIEAYLYTQGEFEYPEKLLAACKKIGGTQGIDDAFDYYRGEEISSELEELFPNHGRQLLFDVVEDVEFPHRTTKLDFEHTRWGTAEEVYQDNTDRFEELETTVNENVSTLETSDRGVSLIPPNRRQDIHYWIEQLDQ